MAPTPATSTDIAVPARHFDWNNRFRLDLLFPLFGYLYILRVPVLLFVIVAFLTTGGLIKGIPGESFLRGIYEVAWPPSPAETFPMAKVVLRFFLVTLSAFMFAIALASNSRIILLSADRFGADCI